MYYFSFSSLESLSCSLSGMFLRNVDVFIHHCFAVL
uniref:Uncharacterized protein n=1 Tax=Arundo donax TaxID=35708 RepID=A0A0A9C7F4_ARUDO